MRAKISFEQKEKILKESREGGCVIRELAKKYGISPTTIHMWRRVKNRNKKNHTESKSPTNFIEVAIKKEEEKQLKKVELVYDDFRIEIEGEISSTKIAPIMQILEGK